MESCCLVVFADWGWVVGMGVMVIVLAVLMVVARQCGPR